MEYKCPNCNKMLHCINNKLVCETKDCTFQCSIDSYEITILPWNIQKCKDSSLWNSEAFTEYPFIISKEYDRLHYLLEQNKLYGVMFQIKDLFEVVLKFAIIIKMSIVCNDKKRENDTNEIISKFFEKALTLGDWQNIANLFVKLENNTNCSINNILKDLVSIYEKNKIVKWRNDNIGHGALVFDDTKEFKCELEKMIKLVKSHFDKCNNDYIKLKFTYENENENEKKSILLKGCNLDAESLKSEGKLFFYNEATKCEIKDFMKVEKNGVYFFDSYFIRKKEIKMLDYVNAKQLIIKSRYMEELYRDVSKNIAIGENLNSNFNDDTYFASEEEVIDLIDRSEEIIEPKYLKDWLEKRLEKDSKGLYLMQMEEGMGKTTFARMLDPHSKKKIKFADVTIRNYYINNVYSHKVDIFKNNIIEELILNDDMTDSIKGNISRFTNDEAISQKKQFSNIIEAFRKIYQKKYNKKKLLIIIDGVDEIPNMENKNILDFIPNYEELQENVYILITSRVEVENTMHINSKLDHIKFNDKLLVYRYDESYLEVLKKYIIEKLHITSTTEISEILKKADNKFIYIRPVEYILKNKSMNNENIGKLNIYREFLEILQANYHDKYFEKVIDLLIVLSIVREPLSMKEMSYLINGSEPDFKFLAYITDINCLIKKERSYRGTIISLSHSSIRDYIVLSYKQKLDNIIKEWIDQVKNMQLEEVSAEEKYLLLNSVYLTNEYYSTEVKDLITHEKLEPILIYDTFVNNIKRYDIHLMMLFLDDLIKLSESSLKKYSKNNLKNQSKHLCQLYILCTQLGIHEGFGGENIYYDYIDKVIKLVEKYNETDDIVLLKGLRLRSEYYRKIGNVKKSMDDEMKIGRILEKEKFETKEVEGQTIFIEIELLMLLTKSINLKNLGKIEEAIQIALEVKARVENKLSLNGNIIYSDVLNQLGLCYLKIENNVLAEAYFRESIRIIEDISKKTNIGFNTFYKYANLGQFLRKSERLDEALEVYNNSIDEIDSSEKQGYLVDANMKALQYNGRSNVYKDLACKMDKRDFYMKAINDYTLAARILEDLDERNRDLRLLGKVYINLIDIYKNIFEDFENANIFELKNQELRRHSVRTQLDLVDEDDFTIDEKANQLQVIDYFENANRLFEQKKFKQALDLYQDALNMVYKLSDQTGCEVKGLLSSIYYNKSKCAHMLLNERIFNNYNLSIQGEQIDDDYSKFEPLGIIEGFLQCEKLITLEDNRKLEIYAIISNIYCDVLKDFKEAKVYALKVIDIDKSNMAGYRALGDIFYELGKFDESICNYNKAIIIEPNDYGIKKNLEAATIKKIEEENFKRSMHLDAKEEELEYLENIIANKLEDVNCASEISENLDLYSNLGIAYNSIGNYEKAKFILEKTLELSKLHMGIENRSTILSYYNLALHYIQNKKNSKQVKQQGVNLIIEVLELSEKCLGEMDQTTIMIKHYFNKYIVPFSKIII